MSILDVAFTAAFAAMAKIFIVFMIGMYCAHAEYLTHQFIVMISNFSFNILVPCLVLSNLSKQLSWESLQTWWTVIVWAMWNIVSGYLVAYGLVLLTKPRKEYVSTFISAIAYSNSLSMAIVVMESMAYSEFFISDPDTISYSTGFFFVYGVGWNIIMYTVGYPYLLGMDSVAASPVIAPTTTTPEVVEVEDKYPPKPVIREAMRYYNLVCRVLSTIRSFLFGWIHWPEWCSARTRFVLTSMATNPMSATTVLALLIGVWPALKTQLYTNGAGLRPLMLAIEFLGGAAVPVGLLVTSGNVYHALVRNYGRDARKREFYINKAIEEEGVSLDSLNVEKPTTFKKGAAYDQFEDNDSNIIDMETAKNTQRNNAHSDATCIDVDKNGTNPVTADSTTNSNTNTNTNTSTSNGSMNVVASGIAGDIHHSDDDDDHHDGHREGNHDTPTLAYSRSTYVANVLGGASAAPPVKPGQEVVIERDIDGSILPLPRFTAIQMLALSSGRLIICPFVTLGMVCFVSWLGLDWLLPRTRIYRVCTMMGAMNPSAEAVLMIVTKAGKPRKSMALSLAYVVQYIMCLISIPINLMIIIYLTEDL